MLSNVSSIKSQPSGGRFLLLLTFGIVIFCDLTDLGDLFDRNLRLCDRRIFLLCAECPAETTPMTNSMIFKFFRHQPSHFTQMRRLETKKVFPSNFPVYKKSVFAVL